MSGRVSTVDCSTFPDGSDEQKSCRAIEKILTDIDENFDNKKDYNDRIRELSSKVFTLNNPKVENINVDILKKEYDDSLKSTLAQYNQVLERINTELKPKLALIRDLKKEALHSRLANGGIMPGQATEEYKKKIANLEGLLIPQLEEKTKILESLQTRIISIVNNPVQAGGCGCGVAFGGEDQEGGKRKKKTNSKAKKVVNKKKKSASKAKKAKKPVSKAKKAKKASKKHSVISF